MAAPPPLHITVLVADDHLVVREGIVAFIDRQMDMKVVARASDGQKAVEQFLAVLPDICLLDLRMPMMDGIDATRAIRREVTDARVVILTAYEASEDIYRALRAGAQGYLFKCCAKEESLGCIRAVCSGRSWIPSEVGAKLAIRGVAQNQTKREGDVLGALAIGKSNKEIGTLFDISEATVKVHMTHILGKLCVASRTEAINAAVRRGLVRLQEEPSHHQCCSFVDLYQSTLHNFQFQVYQLVWEPHLSFHTLKTTLHTSADANP